jgi:hypothetical protein
MCKWKGYAVAHFVEELRYKLGGCAFGGVIGIFERHDPSGQNVALGST